MTSRFWDRIANWFRGRSRPNWCSIHHRWYNADVFKDCPDCLAENGPFFHGHEPEPNSKKDDKLRG